jgi:hypothetical protein
MLNIQCEASIGIYLLDLITWVYLVLTLHFDIVSVSFEEGPEHSEERATPQLWGR